MSILLYVTQDGAHYWQRHRNGWQRIDVLPKTSDPIWVLTNLAGESFIDIEIPRLHGRNRRDLVERQLAAHFPNADTNTPWRTALNIRPAERRRRHDAPMAPMRCALFGIADGKRLDAELQKLDGAGKRDTQNISIAALNATSLLLAGIGQDPQLPAELFIVLPDACGLRIVFLQERRPLLTRLAPLHAQAQADTLVEEIERTCRHLESAHLLQRDQHAASSLPILVLGEHAEFKMALAAARYAVLASPAAWQRIQDDSDQPLFDLSMRKQPFGQLAPLAHRRHHLAAWLRKPALMASALLAMGGAAATAGSFMEYRQLRHRLAEQQTEQQQLNAAIAALDQPQSRSDAKPELVRQAVQLHAREFVAPPVFESYLRALASVLDEDGRAPLRLNSLEWRLSDGRTPPCATAASAADAPGASDAADGAPQAEARLSVRLVRLVRLPEARPASGRTALLQDISTRLARLPGTRLVADPARTLARATLQGDAQAGSHAPEASWCLALTAAGAVDDDETNETSATSTMDEQP